MTFFFTGEDGFLDWPCSRGLGEVYRRQTAASVGIEPARGNPIGSAGPRLGRSAKMFSARGVANVGIAARWPSENPLPGASPLGIRRGKSATGPPTGAPGHYPLRPTPAESPDPLAFVAAHRPSIGACPLYTSDAADEEDSVVLCGSRSSTKQIPCQHSPRPHRHVISNTQSSI